MFFQPGHVLPRNERFEQKETEETEERSFSDSHCWHRKKSTVKSKASKAKNALVTPPVKDHKESLLPLLTPVHQLGHVLPRNERFEQEKTEATEKRSFFGSHCWHRENSTVKSKASKAKNALVTPPIKDYKESLLPLLTPVLSTWARAADERKITESLLTPVHST